MIRVLLLLLIVGLSIFLLTKPSPSGEGFVVYGKQSVDLCLPYQQASKLGMKIIARSNYKLGDKRGTLVYRLK